MARPLSHGLITAALCALCSGPFAAQDNPNRAHFDVVSIVIDKAGTGGAGDRFPKNGTWHWTRIPLSFLIQSAYDTPLNRIENIPRPFKEPDMAFSITAKMPANVTDAQFREMLQSMLADRFHFAMHFETRDTPVNTIEVAAAGPKLKPASGDCVKADKSTAVPAGQHRCGEIEYHIKIEGQTGYHSYTGRSVTVAALAAELSKNGPAMDETGLTGLFDLDVSYQGPMHSGPSTPEEAASSQAEYHHMLRQAFETQAGLIIDLGKFKKRPMQVVVVDRVEPPTPN